MKNDDAQLIQRVLNGDDTAFTDLVEKYQKPIHALVWRKIGDFHIAEELTQDTFLKAYQKLGTLKKPQRFASWLYVIAANRCNTWLRKNQRQTRLLQNRDSKQLENPSYSDYILEENERITAKTQSDVVQKLLAKLGESERTVMTLHYFGEMSCTEIGAFLGVSANTIKSRLRRAQQRLQKEEVMIREAIDNFQISPTLTEDIMREISRVKPAAPSVSKPLIPWVISASTLVVIILILGFGNSRYLARFQKPYSLDTHAETTVEIVDTPLIANLESKPVMRVQKESGNAQSRTNRSEQQPNDASTIDEAKTNEITEDYTKWELPKTAKARLGKSGINAMQFSPDGALLAVGSDIGMWLYDAKTAKEVSMFPGKCESIAFSPDGRFLANGGSGEGGSSKYHVNEVQLWEVATGRKVTLTENPPPATKLLFSDDGKTLISLGDRGETFSILTIGTGKVNTKKIKERSQGITYSQSYALTHDKFAIGKASGEIQLYDTISVWDTILGKELPIFRGDSGQPEQENTRKKNVFHIEKGDHVPALTFSPDGSQLAIGGMNTTVLLCDITKNDEPKILSLRQQTSQVQELAYPPILAFSPNGKILARGNTDKTLQLWKTDTGKSLGTLTGHINGISALTFSPDGSTLVSASADGTVVFWNIETLKPLPLHISEHLYTQRGMAILNDSNMLASVAYNGIITYWDLNTQRKSHLHTNRHCDILSNSAFSPDGTKLATANQQLIHLTDVRTGNQLASMTEPMYRRVSASAMAVSPDGKTVALGDSWEIRLWNTDTDQILYMAFTESPSMISTVIFSHDGNKLVSGDSQGKVQIWDAKSGIELTNFLTGDGIDNPMDNNKRFVLPRNLITALAFSSDDSLLAVGSFEKIHLFGSPEKKHIKKVADIYCNALVFSPDNTVLVVGLITGGIQLLDIPTGDKLTTLDGHTAVIQKLLFSSDGKTLLSTGYDGTILLWDWDEVLSGLDR